MTARGDGEGEGGGTHTHFWDHSRFMPDCMEKAASISCCSAESVGTGLEEGVGAGMTKALRISSVVALRTKSSSLTMQRLRRREGGGNKHRKGGQGRSSNPSLPSLLTRCCQPAQR